MEINKVQWRMIAKGEKLPCDSFLMKKDGTVTSMVTGAGVTVGQDAYYLPVEELRSLPKEENKDERIRKALLNVFATHKDYEIFFGVSAKDIIAWLEKQGKTFPILSNSSNIGKVEQKPDENKGMNLKEEEMTPFQKEVFYIIDTNIEAEVGLKQECDELLRLAYDEIMQNTAWSEEDKETIDYLIDYLESELDSSYTDLDKETFAKDIKLLKSLRPKNTWRPSDEQMDAIDYVKNFDYGGYKDILVSLYYDLKKLREE